MIINQRPITIIRGPRVIYWGGFRRTLVPLSVLGAITIGTTFYEPDGYVALARPVCRGITPDGCSLGWRDVPTVDGDVVPQCVQFCPRPAAVGVPVAPPVAPPPVMSPPPAAAAPAPAAGCEIVVFTEANFRGQSATVTEDESQLSEDWDTKISSARVISGTWDLYDDENFNGEATRLPKGNYATLGQEWTGRIRSMMCSDPGQ